MASQWRFPKLIAHRGGGRVAPENTMAGLCAAVVKNFSAVEFDVKLTREGELVLLHDDTVDRTTDGSGSAADKTLAEISLLDAGGWFSEVFSGEKVPTYFEAATYCRNNNLFTNAEIKPNPGQDAQTGVAVALATSTMWKSNPERVLLSSFSAVALAAAQDTAPDTSRALIVEQIPADWQMLLARYGCIALHCHYRDFSSTLAQQVHAAGYALCCYTVNDIVTARELFAAGADALFTDALTTVTAATVL